MEINVIPKFLDEAVTPVAQSVGNTLSSIWTIAFGGIDIYAEKAKFKRVQALNKFKEEVEQKVSSVPEEKLIEPPLHIIGPTLEASKFYFESDELRIMFANLIAASINVDTIDKAHPSFVEIIKQLSPTDAKNMSVFKIRERHPIVQYELTLKENKGTIPYKTNVFLENPEIFDIEINATSLSNLNRLGLVDIDYNHHLIDEARYQVYSAHPEFYKINDVINANEIPPDNYFYQFEKIDLKKGVVQITPLGRNFVALCI